VVCRAKVKPDSQASSGLRTILPLNTLKTRKWEERKANTYFLWFFVYFAFLAGRAFAVSGFEIRMSDLREAVILRP
jgi:hypothetical protein